MKKTTAILMLLLLGSFTEASPSAVPAERVEEYKKAAKTAIKDVKFTCKNLVGSGSNYLNYTLENAREAEVSTEGDQLILVLRALDTNRQVVSTLITGNDFKTVIMTRSDFYVFGYVNKGDLKNPNIVPSYILSGSTMCVRN